MLLRDLELLIAVAEHGHVGRAADALAVTQPAVTKGIKRLESDLGQPLFVRTPKGVVLTSQGNAFLKRAQQVRRAIDDGRQEISDLASGAARDVRFGLGPNLVEFFATHVSGSLGGEDAPRFLALTDSNEALLEALVAGRLEFVFCAFPSQVPAELAWEPLAEDQSVVVARIEHPIRRLAVSKATDVARYSWAVANEGALSRRNLEQAFGHYGLPSPSIAFESNSLQLILATVARTDLLGYQPRYVLHGARERWGVGELDIEGLNSPRVVGIMTRKGGYVSPAALATCELIRHQAADRLVLAPPG